MAGAFIVVLLVASGTSEDPATALVAKTAQNALDDQTIVVVRDIDSKKLTNHAEATRIGESLDAGAVVVLSWKNRQQSAHLQIRAERKKDSDWIEKSLTFADADPSSERMRTVGFEVAAMIARRSAGANPSSQQGPKLSAAPAANAPSPPSSAASDSTSSSSSSSSSPSSSAPSSPNNSPPTETDSSASAPTLKPPPPPEKETSDPARIALDVVGHGAFAAKGVGANGLGGELGARIWLFNEWIAPHFAFGGRFAPGSPDNDSANATSVALRGSLGMSVRFVRPNNQTNRFGLGVRGDLHVLSHYLSREDNPVSNGSALVGGASGMLEASWSWWRSLSLVGAGGVEVAFGSVDVFVDQQKTSTIAPVRAVFELGARWTSTGL